MHFNYLSCIITLLTKKLILELKISAKQELYKRYINIKWSIITKVSAGEVRGKRKSEENWFARYRSPADGASSRLPWAL